MVVVDGVHHVVAEWVVLWFGKGQDGPFVRQFELAFTFYQLVEVLHLFIAEGRQALHRHVVQVEVVLDQVVALFAFQKGVQDPFALQFHVFMCKADLQSW